MTHLDLPAWLMAMVILDPGMKQIGRENIYVSCGRVGGGPPLPEPCFPRKGEFLWRVDAAVHGGGDTVTGQGTTVTSVWCRVSGPLLTPTPTPRTHLEVLRF